MKVPNLRDWRPDSSQAVNVSDTKMLGTEARESVDMNEQNEVGKELVVTHPDFGKLGVQGRE